ncbi:hypothetical protein BJY52DRAFT_947963 [Lactarius psammicola]|nr:hypothetical protein BJY52DRAFT_947963 [Lactarius psammicola]
MFALEPLESMPTNIYITTPLSHVTTPSERTTFLQRPRDTRLAFLLPNSRRKPSVEDRPVRVLATEIMRGVRLRFSFTFTYVLFMVPCAHTHTCRFCGDAEFMRNVWKRHDAPTGGGDTGGGGARVLTPLISTLNCLNNQRPSLIGHFYPDTRRW